MFDFRNHGESDPIPNGGKAGVGLEEYQDVSAAMDFILKDDKPKISLWALLVSVWEQTPRSLL